MKLLSLFGYATLFFGLGVYANPSEEVFLVPEPKVGDSCTHLRTIKGLALQPLTSKVVEVKKSGWIAETRIPSGMIVETWIFTADGNPQLRQNSFGKTAWEPYIPYFKWPAKVGDRWEGKYSYPVQGGASGTVMVKASVATYEKITVLAGSFDTLKIVLNGTYQEGNGSGRRDEVVWYAPSIRCVVKSTLQATRFDGVTIAIDEVRELVAHDKAQ